MLDIFSEVRDAITNVIDKRPEYGDGSDGDVVYSVDTNVTASVYAETIIVQPGVTVTITASDIEAPVLHARNRITNRGTIIGARVLASSERPGTVGGAGYDYAGGLVDPGGPGGGGSAGTNDNALGGDLTPLFGPIASEAPYSHVARRFWDYLNSAAWNAGNGFGRGYSGDMGSSGGSSGSATSGVGGDGGGWIGLVAPIVDNTDGVVSVSGGAGGSASDDADPPAWQALTLYTGGDGTRGAGNPPGSAVVEPATPNGHAYALYGTANGTSAGSHPTWPTDGSSVADGTVTWLDLGLMGSAGGGGGGSGGIVAAFYRQWIGPLPVLTGGGGGAGVGSGQSGHAGRAGVFLELVDR